MADTVTYHRDDTIGVITMDDGKVNALGPAMQDAVNAAIDRADADDIGALVIAGNNRVLSAGFDLKVFQSGDLQAAVDMLKGGFEISHKLLSYKVPVVIAATGPAVAMGSFLLCSGDHRISGETFRIQANEVVIGLVPPWAALEVMQLRLTPAAYQQSAGLAKAYSGQAAIVAGWVDEIVADDQVLTRAKEAAREFAATLDRGAHVATKLRTRREALVAIRAGIDNMAAEFGG